MYIKHLYDETQVIPEYPVTREEMFILKAGEELHDVTIEQLTATENKTYSEEGVAYSPVIVNVPLPENAYLLKEIEDVEIATFTDGSDLPMPKLEVAIEPQQDLHGYDAPWVGGSGKNKLPLTEAEMKRKNTSGTWNNNAYTINGLTFTIKTDESNNIIGINVNGTANNDTTFTVYDETLNLGAEGSYTMSGCPLNGSTSTYRLSAFRPNSGSAIDVGNGIAYSYNEPIRHYVFITIISGTTLNNLLFQPMIESGNTKTTFAPYSNICPIIGWDEVNVGVAGKNLYKAELNNYYLDVTTGLPVAQAGYEISGFIPILANQSIYIPGSGSSRRWFYDKYKNPKTYLNNSEAQTYTAQKDGYIRVTLNKTISTYSTYQIEYGSTATAYEPYNGHTYTLDLDGTRYGGKVDLVSGVMTVDRVIETITSMEYYGLYGDDNAPLFYKDLTNLYKPYINTTSPISDRPISNYYNANTYWSDVGMMNGEFRTQNVTSPQRFYFRDDRFTSKTQMDNWLSDNAVQICGYLATPITIQLSPTVVKSLRGKNNVFADTGNILDLSYLAKEE